jgi:hypothetical protein
MSDAFVQKKRVKEHIPLLGQTDGVSPLNAEKRTLLVRVASPFALLVTVLLTNDRISERVRDNGCLSDTRRANTSPTPHKPAPNNVESFSVLPPLQKSSFDNSLGRSHDNMHQHTPSSTFSPYPTHKPILASCAIKGFQLSED